MKELIMTVAIAAMTITACSPQEKVIYTPPQTTVTESMLKAQDPLLWGNMIEKIFNLAVTLTPAAATPEFEEEPEQEIVGTVEQNLIDHMLKQKDSKGNQKVSEKNAKEWAKLIIGYCESYKVDPYTILAMMQVESNFSPNLVGRANDVGLLQVRPTAQKSTGIKGDRKNPSVNIEIAVKYLAYNQERFGEDLGIVAYNQGEGNVAKGTYNTKYLTKVNKALETISR
ncbi:lytic transglycosylase domain-containing protein [Paenibacillus sp. NPDC057967]|uniref:lytic transglycosylase domain-containing protein n=1 Tax=Paenibacillus sp. NPDC057967 TaxID=3346293 RepID=UPI0036DF6439